MIYPTNGYASVPEQVVFLSGFNFSPLNDVMVKMIPFHTATAAKDTQRAQRIRMSLNLSDQGVVNCERGAFSASAAVKQGRSVFISRIEQLRLLLK